MEGRIEFETVKQVPNEPRGRHWDIDLLVGFCREAVEYAGRLGASIGIDSWGVDHGFLDKQGNLVQSPIIYRDAAHAEQFETFARIRKELFQLTGIAHQPFNTLYQLAARSKEDPSLPEKVDWYLLPDLLGYLLTGVRNHEQTQCSTTQLMGLNGKWSKEAFDIVGWPVPDHEPQPCAKVIGSCDGVPLVSVASHDTGSAVVGVGTLEPGDAYLNVGTWALLGVRLERPNTSEVAERGNWTNEWAHDGSIRFLKNIPGFFVINRLHTELGLEGSVGQWLESRDKSFAGRFDPHDSSLYSPENMRDAVFAACTEKPVHPGHWAEAALMSLVECISRDIPDLVTVSGPIKRLRVVGGGSRSREFCKALGDYTRLEVAAGPVEATVLGNLAIQFVATGETTMADMPALVQRSFTIESVKSEGEQCLSG